MEKQQKIPVLYSSLKHSPTLYTEMPRLQCEKDWQTQMPKQFLVHLQSVQEVSVGLIKPQSQE